VREQVANGGPVGPGRLVEVYRALLDGDEHRGGDERLGHRRQSERVIEVADRGHQSAFTDRRHTHIGGWPAFDKGGVVSHGPNVSQTDPDHGRLDRGILAKCQRDLPNRRAEPTVAGQSTNTR